MAVITSTLVAVITVLGAVTDLAQGTGQTGLVRGTGRIDQTDLVLVIVQVTDLLPEVETGPGLVADQVREQGQVHARVRDKDRVLGRDQAPDRVREQDQVRAQAQAQDRVQERDQVHGQAQERDQVQGQVQWIDQGQDLVRDKVVPEPVVEVPWAATRAGVLLPGIVSVVDPVVPANLEPDRQGVPRAGVAVEADQRAEVAVVVAEVEVDVVAVADVDVDLKWR